MIIPIILSLALEYGAMPNYSKIFGAERFVEPVYYQLIDAKATAYDIFFLRTTTLIESVKSDSWQFGPVNSTYTLSAGAKFHGLTIGAEHSCTHPVVTIGQSGLKIMDYLGGYDKLYVRYGLEYRP